MNSLRPRRTVVHDPVRGMVYECKKAGLQDEAEQLRMEIAALKEK